MQAGISELKKLLRKVIVKIGLDRIDKQEEITVEVLFDSKTAGLVLSSEFTRKQGFKLKKIEKPIYIRNVNETFNKERPIENTVKVNIFIKDIERKQRTEIDIIDKQKWSVILKILWLTYHNYKIN